MSVAELQPFEAEHADLRRGLEQLRQAAALLDTLDADERRAEIREAVEFLQGPLARHAAAEEAVLYPAVARLLRHPAAAEPMVFDHELVRTRAGELAGADPDDLPRLRELLLSLHTLLDTHFRKEERFLLPLLAGSGRASVVQAAMERIEREGVDAGDRQPTLGPHGFPLDGSAAEKLGWAVPYAVQAPSSHNSQPWRFRVAGSTLELHADRTRALSVVDPDDRELTISCGAALLHLRAALRKAGEVPEAVLLPAEDADLLARVSLGDRREPSRREKQDFWSMRKRRTNRGRFKPDPVPEEVKALLTEAAAAEGATLVVVEEGERREALARLVAEADRLQAADPSFRRELASWLHPSRSQALDGMPASAAGVTASSMGPYLVRRFDWGRGRAARDEQLALGSPVLAVLTTPGDEPADWLAAGQALALVLLRATTEDLAASYLNQPVEVPELRTRLAGLVGGGIPQLVLRLGYPTSTPPATPRRALADVLA
ncbi:MAG TPA: hemerythrin domain-containing protein [Gaiellaceae bacterium]|nr:hemerythrin domain-containing protein [Gaiellaceae bacterium]